MWQCMQRVLWGICNIVVAVAHATCHRVLPLRTHPPLNPNWTHVYVYLSAVAQRSTERAMRTIYVHTLLDRSWTQALGAGGRGLALGLGGLSQLSILGGGFALANCVAAARFMWTQITVAWLMYAGGGRRGGSAELGQRLRLGSLYYNSILALIEIVGPPELPPEIGS